MYSNEDPLWRSEQTTLTRRQVLPRCWEHMGCKNAKRTVSDTVMMPKRALLGRASSAAASASLTSSSTSAPVAVSMIAI